MYKFSANIIFIFIVTASLLYSKEIPLIKAKAGYVINFGKESEEVFNKMQQLNNKDSVDYTKSEEEIYLDIEIKKVIK